MMFAPRYAAPVLDYRGQGYGDGFQLVRSASLSSRLVDGPLPPRPSEIDGYAITRGVQLPPDPFGFDPASDRHHAKEAEPMQATAKHPKLKLKIILASHVYEAGSTISGVLELTTSASQRLRLGEIAIELEAFEELTSRDHAATQIFLFNRTLFQGEHLPPSNAVLPAAPMKGHWTARKGRTTFPFSFKVPATCPSSIDFSGHARLRYALKGTVQAWWNDSKTLVTVRSDAHVVEKWHDELDPRFKAPVEALADTHVFMGGNGAVWLEAAVAEQLFVAGTMCNIRAGVKNNSKRNLSGLKVLIARRLTLAVPETSQQPAQRLNLEPHVTEIIHTQEFKGPSFEFPPREEVIVDLAVSIPHDVRSIRKTRLFEVSIVAIVCIDMGTFAKDLLVELPFSVAHSASLQSPQPHLPTDGMAHLPRRAKSSMAQHGQHRAMAAQPCERSAPSPLPNPYHRPMTTTPATSLPPASPLPHPQHFTVPQVLPRPLTASPMHSVQQLASGPALGGVTAPIPCQMETLASGNERMPLRTLSAQDVYHPTSLASDAVGYHALPPRPITAQQAAHELPFPQALHAGIRRSQILAPSDVPITQQLWGMQGLNAQERAGPSAPKSYLAASPEVQRATPRSHNAPEATLAQEKEFTQRNSIVAEQISFTQAQRPLSQPAHPAVQNTAALMTITEDPESNAGTLRGTHKLDSVSQKDIDQFERMAQAAEDEEEARKAMKQVGMVPDDGSFAVKDPFSKVLKDKTWPKGPMSTTKKSTASTAKSKPTVADLFQQKANMASQDQLEKPLKSNTDSVQQLRTVGPTEASRDDPIKSNTEASSTKLNTTQKPSNAIDRPASSQGRGLASLESRLQSCPSASSRPSEAGKSLQVALSISTPQCVPRTTISERKRDEHVIADSALKAAAEAATERERREKQENDVHAMVVEQRFLPKQNKEDVEVVALPGSFIPEQHPSGLRQDDGRKHVDADEMRVLNKEAVDRIAGWLSTPSTSNVVDVTSSPKTPSPSVICGVDSALIDSCTRDASARQISIVPTTESQGNVRRGRGGRVASIASMWASIAEGTDGSVIKSSTPVVTLRPKAQCSGRDGTRALDFSPKSNALADATKTAPKSTLRPSPMPIKATEPMKKGVGPQDKGLPTQSRAPMSPPIVVKNRVRSPSASKSDRAARFVNTTMPRPVFSSQDTSSDCATRTPTKVVNSPAEVPPALRKLADQARQSRAAPQPVSSNIEHNRLKASRKITSDLVAAEARQHAGIVVIEQKKKNDEAKQGTAPTSSEHDGKDLPMGGRGTTKPIGRAKLASLRSIWGG